METFMPFSGFGRGLCLSHSHSHSHSNQMNTSTTQATECNEFNAKVLSGLPHLAKSRSNLSHERHGN